MQVLYGEMRAAGTSPEYTAEIVASVAEMVRMSAENGERPIQLFEQHYASQFMRQSHFAERKGRIGVLQGSGRETVGWTNGKNQRQRIAVAVFGKKPGKFLRSKVFAARIQKHQPLSRAAAFTAAIFQERGFVLERNSFRFAVLTQTLQVIVTERLNGMRLCFSNPGDGEFHGVS